MVLSFFFSECAPSTTFHLTFPGGKVGFKPHAFAGTGFECRYGKEEIYNCSLCQAGSFNQDFTCLPCSAGKCRKITGWIKLPFCVVFRPQDIPAHARPSFSVNVVTSPSSLQSILIPIKRGRGGLSSNVSGSRYAVHIWDRVKALQPHGNS